MNKVNYGFDAPAIMKNLILVGLVILITGFSATHFIQNTVLNYIIYLITLVGAILFILGFSMYFYGIKGKFLMRDFMLTKIDWKGNEYVLDIGAGTGLLMNGVAKFLTTGKSIGIDIWRAEDLSGNTIENAYRNAELENVKDKIEIRTEDARQLSFEENTFDVVVSMFCIHNIDNVKEQEKACFEIARVLKQNGTVLIGDYIPTHQYAKYFQKAGLKVISSKNYISTAYTLMWMVVAKKV
jgi:ubiquinone/menaquinone biosynthesis C-methylase UbiE